MNTRLLSLTAAALAALPAASATTVWTETGDAGDALLTSQATVGGGSLTQISGTLPTDSDVDIYRITITNSATFTAWKTGTVTTDPDLWLFDSAGVGIAHNDVVLGGYTSLSGVPAAGDYYLAITNDGAEALSAGGLIWTSPYGFSGSRAPDGPGAAQPFANWSGTMLNNGSAYTIHLQGAEFSAIPEPATTALLACGGLLVSRRRR